LIRAAHHHRVHSSIEWRRNKVLELASQGHNQHDIARLLHINQSTISRDLSILRQEAKQNIKKYIDERLPEEYEKCLIGLTSILKEAWITAAKSEDKREKLQALSLAKECYSMKLELLTNATVVDDAIRFVNERTAIKKDRPSYAIAKSNPEPVVTQDEESDTLTTAAADAPATKNHVF
jgi:predicted transcriptional regulator